MAMVQKAGQKKKDNKTSSFPFNFNAQTFKFI